MDFLVMGAGAIGSVVGAFLCLAGHRVFFLGRGERVIALQEKGLTLTGIWGDRHLPQVEAGSSIEDLSKSGMHPDWIFLAVKSHDTRTALEQISPIVMEGNGVASLQNGLGNVEAIAELAGPGRTVAGRVIFGARIPKPGTVEVTVCADDLLLGPLEDERQEIHELCQVIGDSGIPCRYEERIISYIWDKVIYNSCLNAPGTLLNSTYGELADDPDTWSLMEGIVRECYMVAGELGIDLISATADDFLARFRDQLIPPTRDHYPSMQEDISRGRKTEIDALNGAVARLARERGLSAPMNEALARMISFVERRSTERL